MGHEARLRCARETSRCGFHAWGHLPRPGTAEVFEYPHFKDGRMVADVVRMGRGHTEGLEPLVTEQHVKLMLSAKK